MFVLAVDIDEILSQFAQHLNRHRAAVDEAARRFVGFDHAPQHAFLIVEELMLLEPFGGGVCWFEREVRGHFGARAAVANDIAVGAVAQHQRQGIDEDGLAGAGLSGQHAEARIECDLKLVHDGEVTDIKVLQHVVPAG